HDEWSVPVLDVTGWIHSWLRTGRPAVRRVSGQPTEAAHARFVEAQGVRDLVQDRVGDRAPQGFSAAVIPQVRTPVDRDDVGSPKTTPVDDLVRRPRQHLVPHLDAPPLELRGDV